MSFYTDRFEDIYRMSRHKIKKNFKFLGEGIARKAYQIDSNFVAKIAKNRDGFYQCAVEWHVYTHCGLLARKYLCPILWYRPGMIIMPLATPLTDIIDGEDVDPLSLLGNRVSYYMLQNMVNKFDLLPGDITAASSWGILDNKPVLIDYGCTNYLHEEYYLN